MSEGYSVSYTLLNRKYRVELYKEFGEFRIRARQLASDNIILDRKFLGDLDNVDDTVNFDNEICELDSRIMN